MPNNDFAEQVKKQIAQSKQIYLLAKRLDVDALQQLLADKVSLDSRNEKEQTPGEQLAAEGNIPAAELLRTLGASTDFIARGAGLGRQRDYAAYLRVNYEEDPRRRWSHISTEIAIGAIRGGDLEHAEFLRIYHKASLNDLCRVAYSSKQKEYGDYLITYHGANNDCYVMEGATGANKLFNHRNTLFSFQHYKNKQNEVKSPVLTRTHRFI